MNKIFSLGLLLASAVSAPLASASTDPVALMSALREIGVHTEGTKAAAMAGVDFDDQGRQTFHMAVFFAHIVGSMTLSIRDVTLFETPGKSVLVMTYAAGETTDTLTQETKIVPVTTDAHRTIADAVRANSTPTDETTHPAVKITAYSVERIACSRVVYPGAEPSCTVSAAANAE